MGGSTARILIALSAVENDRLTEALAFGPILRLRRGAVPQRQIAEAAGVPLSCYRGLERGRAHGVGLDALQRISKTLHLDRSERLNFWREARPDLAFLLAASASPMPERQRLRSLHGIANRLRQARGSRAPVRVAVEIIYACLGPDISAFALEWVAGIRPRSSSTSAPVSK